MGVFPFLVQYLYDGQPFCAIIEAQDQTHVWSRFENWIHYHYEDATEVQALSATVLGKIAYIELHSAEWRVMANPS